METSRIVDTLEANRADQRDRDICNTAAAAAAAADAAADGDDGDNVQIAIPAYSTVNIIVALHERLRVRVKI